MSVIRSQNIIFFLEGRRVVGGGGSCGGYDCLWIVFFF